jgi:hypothetical protein
LYLVWRKYFFIHVSANTFGWSIENAVPSSFHPTTSSSPFLSASVKSRWSLTGNGSSLLLIELVTRPLSLLDEVPDFFVSRLLFLPGTAEDERIGKDDDDEEDVVDVNDEAIDGDGDGGDGES